MRTPRPAFRQPNAARLSPLAAALAVALAPAAYAATFTVTNTDDSGAGSLRQAIEDANANCINFGDSAPVVDFNLGGAGPFVIQPATSLPEFYCYTGVYNPSITTYTPYGGGVENTAINGFNAVIPVTLDGTLVSVYGGSCGLSASDAGYGGALTVKGLRIQNFTAHADAAGICGTVDIYGTVLANNSYGASLYGDDRQVGDNSSPGARNVIIGNATAGIGQAGGTIHIVNNFIGTPDGASADGNGVGIDMAYVEPYIYDNVISGNVDGIFIYETYGGSIQGNAIGTDATRDGALPNDFAGIRVNYSTGLYIADNDIHANGDVGISLYETGFPQIADNRIGNSGMGNATGVDIYCGYGPYLSNNGIVHNDGDGVRLSGVEDSYFYGNSIQANGGNGVVIDNGECSSSADNNTFESNTIAGNSANGLLLLDGEDNVVYGGSIYGNGDKNININGSPGPGALPNDPGDGDGGPNDQQNWPQIDSVVQLGNETHVTFTLDTQTETDYQIQAYANPSLGQPAGQTYVGSYYEVNAYGGPFTQTLVLEGLYDNLSLTATSNSYGTSEFSPMRSATVGPAVVIKPPVLDFGNVVIDTTSAPLTSRLSSVGGSDYVISNIGGDSFCYGGPICYGGAFICSTTCDTGTPYSPGSSCTLTATFAPTFPGYQSTQIYFCDNTTASPHIIELVGQAVLPPPITISPVAWDYGNVPVGMPTEPREFVITNVQSEGSVDLLPIFTTGDFELTSTTCTSTLPQGGNCSAFVRFLASASGRTEGEVVAAVDPFVDEQADARPDEVIPLSGPSARAQLAGTGVSGGEMTLPGPQDLGAAIVGGPAVTRTVTLTNSGNGPVTFSSVTVTAPFTLVNNCTVLEAGASCTVVLSFTAGGVGPVTGTLSVVSDATGGSGDIAVSAVGQPIAAPLIRVEPQSIGFGDRVIGSQSASSQITISNVGGLPATLNMSPSTIDYLITSNTCGPALEPQTSCFAQVAFRPMAFGPRIGSFVINSNSAGNPHVVDLSGTGCRPIISSNRLGGRSNCAP